MVVARDGGGRGREVTLGHTHIPVSLRGDESTGAGWVGSHAKISTVVQKLRLEGFPEQV